MPLRLAFGVMGTVAGHRLGALEGGGGTSPPSNASPPPMSEQHEVLLPSNFGALVSFLGGLRHKCFQTCEPQPGCMFGGMQGMWGWGHFRPPASLWSTAGAC